jgi:Domain of unknown function (DUF4184)
MPYTISHVAVVVPFSRLLARMRVLSAVVIGSMVPDFGYLMPTHPARLETHSLLALATFCLPVGLLSYWIFQRLMKTPLVSVLPDQAYMRWRPYSAPASWGSPRQWLLAVCGVLGGAVVHLAWDAFTHENGRGVRLVPELSDPMLEVHDHLVTGATLLQGLSSLMGLLIVIGAIVYALRGSGHSAVAPRPLTRVERRSWVLVFVIVTLGLCTGFFILDRVYGNPYQRWIGIAGLAVALLRALVVAAVLVSLLLKGYLRAKR